jgi:hypothetical protein
MQLLSGTLSAIAVLAWAATASAQTVEPAAPKAPRLSVSVGIRFDFGGTGIFKFPDVWGAAVRGSWTPLPWLGLTGDVDETFFGSVYHIGASVRLGPTLRWPLDRGPVSPYVTAQGGVVGFVFFGAGAAGTALELRGEAGVDVAVSKRFFLSAGGGVAALQFSGDPTPYRFKFGQLSLGMRI